MRHDAARRDRFATTGYDRFAGRNRRSTLIPAIEIMFNLNYRPILPILLLLGPVARAQQPPKILVAAGKERSVGQLNPGALDCAGGQPTGRPLQCSPGTSRIFLWNSVG